MAPRRPDLMRRLRVITAAATQIKVNLQGKANKPPTERWQGDAWDMFDLIPEVGQAAVFMGNVVSGVRLFIAQVPDDPEQPPGPAEAGVRGVAEAEQVLDRLRTGSAHGGTGGLLYASVINLKVPGEYYLLGEPELPEQRDARDPLRITRQYQPERWDVKSIDEIEIKDRGVAIVKDRPGKGGREIKLAGEFYPDDPEACFLLRVWDRHPRYSGLARSSLRAALNECDELLLLGRCIRAAARRYLAGNGLLAVPSELDLPGAPDEGDEQEDPEASPLMKRMAKAMVESMADEGNPDSLVPLLLMGPGDILQKLQHIAFGKPFDPEARALMGELRTRLASSLDLPIEQLTGIAQVNHWGAWQIDGASWARYGQPTTRLIVESWTEGLLWPMLEEAGVSAEEARRLVIWFDPADAIMDPDESKTADELLDRAAIGYEAYRRRKGASEDEAPTEEDLALLERVGKVRPMPNQGGEPVPNGGEAPEDPAARAATNGNGKHPVTAASRPRQTLGQRLASIDRNLRTRLEEAAEAALRRALQLAGARVRSKAQGNDNVTAAIASVPNHLVASRLGQAVVAAMATEDELLQGGVDDLGPRFEQKVSAAQRQAREATAREFDLTDEEVAALEQRQERDRQEAWLWLSAALIGLAQQRLYQPAPTAPTVGEFDTSSSVPPSLIREAMARAGGGMPADGSPPGGVGTGTTILDLWAQHGQVVAGWEWVYGDPTSRTVPFEGHERLDGERFANWDDPVLLVDPVDDWLGVTHYRPGDHDWCQCDFIPLAPGEDVPTEEDRVRELQEALG